MLQPHTPEEWLTLAENIYQLICTDIEISSAEPDLKTFLPKLIVMHEFFRLIRGEAFQNSRPNNLGELQGKLYQMEDSINEKLKGIKMALDPSDEATLYYLENMRKSFDLE